MLVASLAVATEPQSDVAFPDEACSAGPAAVACKADTELLAIGRRIYREGLLPSGQPIQGVGPANVVLSAAQAACATCHRRSGYGSSEGPIEVRAITGSALFGERVAPVLPGSPVAPAALIVQSNSSPAEAARANANALRAVRTALFAGNRPRPAYDDASLTRAIRQGVDTTGRVMNVSMPRYSLDASALEALTAYLKTLSVQTPPGVGEEKVHFATVIQPGTDPAQRSALVEVLQTYMRDRNLGLRAEIRREQVGLVRLQRTYREWVLHVWDLDGPSDTWGAQLEARQQQQPVFALVSGLGNSSWRPIHEFSERFEVPCIFPQVEMPELDGPNFYTVYLSRGLTLEAHALAKYLHEAGVRGPVTQVHRRDGASAFAAEAFRKALSAGGGATRLADRVLDATPDEAYWQQLARQTSNATLVLWLPSHDLAQARALTEAGSRVKAVYLSSGLAGERAAWRGGLTTEGDGQVRLVYPQDLPRARSARLDLVRRWLTNNGIAPAEERLQMNAYLAATVVGMVMSHNMDTYSREFMLERMEHRVGTAHELSIYPHLSLGPGQRYASKGSYIVRVDGQGDGDLTPVSDWIVP